MKKWVLILVKSIPLLVAAILAVCVGVAYSDSFKEDGCPDGTQKETCMYMSKPDNFEEVENAFKELLGAEIFCNK